MKTKTTHTPTPWNHRPKDLQNPVRYITVEDGGFDRIIAHVLPTDKDYAFTNAAFIVRAVNSHEEMLDLMKELLCELDPDCKLDGETQSQDRTWRDNLVIEIYQTIAYAEGK